MKQRRYSNKGKKYLTDHRKSKILTAKIITGIFAIIILPALASFIYTANYHVVSTAYAQVPNRPEVKEMTLYQQISDATNGENVDVIYNLCKAESGCKKYAVNKNTNHTYDYSYFQINSVHIKGNNFAKGKGTITMECVYDIDCSAKWVNSQIKAGNGSIWVAWKNL